MRTKEEIEKGLADGAYGWLAGVVLELMIEVPSGEYCHYSYSHQCPHRDISHCKVFGQTLSPIWKRATNSMESSMFHWNKCPACLAACAKAEKKEVK